MKKLISIFLPLMFLLFACSESTNVQMSKLDKPRCVDGLHKVISQSEPDFRRYQLLLAKPGMEGDMGNGKLWAATFWGDKPTFLEQLKNPKAVEKHGAVALYFANKLGRLGYIEKLLEAGVDVNSVATQSNDGSTYPLFGAAESGCLPSLRLMAKKGANISITRGHTATGVVRWSILNSDIAFAKAFMSLGGVIHNSDADVLIEFSKGRANYQLFCGVYWSCDSK